MIGKDNCEEIIKRWCGKKKAVTFSLDDGVLQDIRVIEILNKYGLCGTFNLNSERLGVKRTLERNGRTVDFTRVCSEKLREIYLGHEIASHTLTHPSLPSLDEAEIIRQVEEDRRALSVLAGYEVVGMAYPGGGLNNDERVAGVIREHTNIRYARTIKSTYKFDLPSDPIRLDPTVYFIEDRLDEVIDEFLALKAETPQLLYIWGHSFEMDAEYISWKKFEEICKKLSARDDIFYGTNRAVLGY